MRCAFTSVIGARYIDIMSQRTRNVIISSLLRQSDVGRSFWRDNDVIIASCAHWNSIASISYRLSCVLESQRRFYSTHWGQDNMAAISQSTFIFLYENDWILIKISLKDIPNGAVKYNQALVLIMAWCRMGEKPLSEPMTVWFTDTWVMHPLWVEVWTMIHHSRIIEALFSPN